jgi:hypothetical protein
VLIGRATGQSKADSAPMKTMRDTAPAGLRELYQKDVARPFCLGHAHTLFEGAVRVRGKARAGHEIVTAQPGLEFEG